MAAAPNHRPDPDIPRGPQQPAQLGEAELVKMQAPGLVVIVVAADVVGAEQAIGRQHDEQAAGPQRRPDRFQQALDVVRMQVLDQLVGDGQVDRTGLHRRVAAIGDDKFQVRGQVRPKGEVLADVDSRHGPDPVTQSDRQPSVPWSDLEHP